MKSMFALTAAVAALAMAAPVSAQAPNDAQIAHIAYTAGSIDVEAGRQALQISHNAAVRAFAETMVRRSEEHTSELQSLMRISYAVFCMKKKKNKIINKHTAKISNKEKRHKALIQY